MASDIFAAMNINPIARFHSPFTSKFGIPKQSGLVKGIEGYIVFEPEYRNPDALRGLDSYDFLWLIWAFSANPHGATSPLVRPPLLGGNIRMGVFATRSPFRPNPIGLSSVQLQRIEWNTDKGPVIHVLGADLMDGTPIYDIKPYVTKVDCHVEARSGFVDDNSINRLTVVIPPSIANSLPQEKLNTLVQVLELDPRPQYQNDPQKVYGMPFESHDIRFSVSSDSILTVIEIVPLHN